MKKINGIFVLGGQRTGTTFLANLLVSQNKILGVTHPKHWGIYESSFFSIIENRFGDLKNKINYLSFISVMSKYDYFRLMGFDFNKLKNLNVDSYKDFFKNAQNIC